MSEIMNRMGLVGALQNKSMRHAMAAMLVICILPFFLQIGGIIDFSSAKGIAHHEPARGVVATHIYVGL